ncbi:MAG: chromate efflux transporter [Cyclobacteriaceae bacterium]|nr:chromate efflux transporter [Cyclobacteriaceae bacterium]
MTERVPYSQFLKDVFQLSVSCFGGPQAHLAYYQRILVEKRSYLTEKDLLELYALCQIVPGPTSTQTLTSVGYRLGGPNLAYLTLIIWMLPSVTVMTLAGIMIGSFQEKELSLAFTRFIQPMAVGFVGYAAYTISLRTVNTRIGFILMVISAVASYFVKTPLVFPIILIVAGTVTAFNYKLFPKEEKKKFDVPWANFFLWAGVFIVAAALGGITKALPIKLFENFYRNGSLIFGGGQVLVPMLYTEFVQYAKPLHFPTSPTEFLSGYALAQAVPGPVFSFSSYIGALSMREWGVGGEILGAIMSAAGIFLPGTFLIFFVIRIWDSLKKFRPIRASLEGINAANAGLVAAAAVLLFQPLDNTVTNFGFMIATFCLLAFTKLPAWSIIATGLVLGFVLT